MRWITLQIPGTLSQTQSSTLLVSPLAHYASRVTRGAQQRGSLLKNRWEAELTDTRPQPFTHDRELADRS